MPIFDKYVSMGAYHWRECDPSSADFNPPLAARYQMIARRVTKGQVLDVGAGDGYLAGLVAGRCERVVALEYEPSGVELAREMLAPISNIEIHQGNIYKIPNADNSFDVIMMADVIEHLHAPERAIAELARVVRAGGVLLVTTPKWRPDRVWDKRHVKEFLPEELEALLLNDFEQVELRFAWPEFWSNLYSTKIGWRLLKWLGRLGFNPFSRESEVGDGFYQMLAIAAKPRKSL